MSFSGPRENRFRPAVDTLFRSAARAHHAHVVAVILSGALDDGSAGAFAVKARHGTVIIEDPALAEQADMPRNVQLNVGADYVLPAAGIAKILTEIVPLGTAIQTVGSDSKKCERLAEQLAVNETEPEMFSCPECDGPLQFSTQNGLTQLRCHVGHAFSMDSFSEAESEALERAIWTAYRKLKEHRTIQITLAKRQTDGDRATRLLQSAEVSAKDMNLLKGILERL